METINYRGKYDSLELLWKAYPGGGIEGDYALIGDSYYGWDKYKSQWVETVLSEQTIIVTEPSVETKDAVNFLGVFDSWADVWKSFPEGGHPGDYLTIDGANYLWDASLLNWTTLSKDANVIEGETPAGSSPGELNYLGNFASMADVWYFFPEGGHLGDFVQVASVFYVWDTSSLNWKDSANTTYVNYDFSGKALEASQTRTTINYLGSFAELNDVWIVYPEGGHEGDYIHLSEEIQVWNKYRSNWGDYETPQTPAIKTDVVDGTLKVVQDLIVGGKLIAKDIDIDINQLKLFTLTFLLQNGDITYNPKLADKTVDLRNFASNEDLKKLKVELSKAIEDLDIDTLKSILSLFTPIYDDAKKLKQIQPNAPLGVDEISSKTFAPGIFGSGFQLSQRADGTSLLTVDSAIIRRSLTVFELIIQQLKHQGGIVFYTAASMEVSAVERVTGGWKCYFDTKNGQVPNQFVVDDQARCQRFNVGTTSSKYYWRLVTAVGLDYIVLSDTDCDEGSDIPEVADTIVQLGNRSNVDNSRKAAIVISSYGDNSPSIMMYTGIDSYSLQGKEIHGTIYRNNNGEYEAYFYNYGSMRLGAREGEDGGYITYDHKTKQLNINAVVNFLPQSTGLEQMESYQKLVKIAQGNIETWFYDGVSPIQSGAPTMSNYPVNTWEADDYENHIGDIYYSNTGKGYRFKRSGSTWGWEIISDTELAQLMADVQSLQYLKDALSDGTTTVAGGLILTSLIQLGYEDAENVRHTMAGISGLGQNSTAPAAWYGGPMVDHELNPDATEFAKSLFRFNGTGYLASGNITWDEKGYGQIGGEGDNYALKWNDKEVRIGPNIKLGAGDETIAMLANLLNMFELDTTSVAGKTLIHAKYDGLYSDGDIAAGGAFAGTPSGGGKTYLNELLDVQLATSSLNVGDMLMWNGAKYVNIPQSSITPDLSEYATKQWVLDKKYLTSVPVTSVVGQTGNITTAQVATALTDAGYKLTDTTYELATTTSNGLMSATDKTKLDGIAANANNYTLPTASSSTKGGIKVGTTLSISGEVLDLKSGFPKGTYTKVQIDDYGRVESGSTLSASDIPSLPWSKITTGKPTTISGYGIEDAYTKTETDNKVAALQSLLDSMFERVYDSNNKLIRIHSNVTISSSGDLVAGSNSEGGGTSGGAYTQLEWNAIKALTQSESGLLASAYSVKEAYNELNTAIATLAGKATNVKFTQTLTSGKQIGSISIDGKSTSLYAPASYAWSEITGKPSFAAVATSGSYTDLANKPTIASLMGSTAIGGTSSYLYWNGSAWATKSLGSNAFTSISKVSQLTNDSGYITGITKAMVESVLTGNITSHTHSYLPLSGGTMSNTNVVTNLNADLLDGYHASQVLTATSSSRDLNEISVPKILRLSDNNPNCPSDIFKYGNLLTVKESSADTAWQLIGAYSSDHLWFRRGTWYANGAGSLRTNAWKEIAFTDSNVASSTQSLLLSNTSDAKAVSGVFFHKDSSVKSLVGNTEGNGVWGHPSDSQDQTYGHASILRIGWSKTYYTDIFTGPNGAGGKYGLQWRQIVNNGANNWRTLLDSSNYSYYVSDKNHTHTFASLTSKPTTISGYGITDALTTANFNSYAPKLDGTGATGTWGINISGNAATATDATYADTLDTTFAQNINYAANTTRLKLIRYDENWEANGFPMNYTSGLSVMAGYCGWQLVTYGGSSDTPYFRKVSDSGIWSNWRALAFTDSNVASSSKWATPRTITLTGSVTGSVSIDGSQNVSLATTTNHTHNYAGSSSAGGSANSALTLLYNNKFDTTYGDYAIFQQNYNISDFPHNGWFNSIKMLHNNSYGYFTEIATSFTGEDGMWRRALLNGAQVGWYKILDSGNYNSYCPSLTGTGATGTWGISISGNAVSATKLQNSRTIWGQSFDGTGNVSGALSEVTSITASSTIQTSGNIIAGGDLTAGSDIRYKDKINDLGLSVHDIALAPAFAYKWNNREDDALVHIGSSAQYWLNTDAKDAVYYDKQNDFYHLNYASLALCNTIILARGMETQEQKIIRLEERIKELEDKIRQNDSYR